MTDPKRPAPFERLFTELKEALEYDPETLAFCLGKGRIKRLTDALEEAKLLSSGCDVCGGYCFPACTDPAPTRQLELSSVLPPLIPK